MIQNLCLVAATRRPDLWLEGKKVAPASTDSKTSRKIRQRTDVSVDE